MADEDDLFGDDIYTEAPTAFAAAPALQQQQQQAPTAAAPTASAAPSALMPHQQQQQQQPPPLPPVGAPVPPSVSADGAVYAQLATLKAQ